MQLFYGNNCLKVPLEDFDIERIGKLIAGAQGEVYKCELQDVNGVFVDKTRTVKTNKELAYKVMTQMYSEFSIAKDLVHPNIVEYKYFLKDFTSDRDAYEYHLITEYLPEGDMEQYLIKNGPCQSIRLVKNIGKQMLEALLYLHKNKIIHQDIKPSNVMFKSKEHIKLIDLGVSSKLDQTIVSEAAGAGTLRYMPPEQHEGKLSFKVDIWAYACVMLQFVTGNIPYSDVKDDLKVSMKIFNERISPLDYELKTNPDSAVLIDPELKILLNKCFEFNHSKRPSALELLNDFFFMKNKFADRKLNKDMKTKTVSASVEDKSLIFEIGNTHTIEKNKNMSIECPELFTHKWSVFVRVRHTNQAPLFRLVEKVTFNTGEEN